MEIEIVELARYIKKHALVLAAVPLILALAVFAVCRLAMTPVYTATARVYVLGRGDGTEQLSYADYQANTLLVEDYATLVQGDSVLDGALSYLALETDRETLREQVTAQVLPGTRIVEISCTDADPILAAQLANTVEALASAQLTALVGTQATSTIYPATVPADPSAPDAWKAGEMAAFLGFWGTLLMLIALGLLRDTLRNGEDIRQVPELTLLGMVFTSKPLKKQTLLTWADAGEAPQIQIAWPATLARESQPGIVLLREYLLRNGAEIQAVALTGCHKKEGRTTMAVLLGTALAHSGKQVLLVSGSFQKNRSVIQGSPLPGLADCLAGRADQKSLICKTNVANLHMVMGGYLRSRETNPLGTPAFQELITSWKAQYDYVLLDFPPLGEQVDCLLAAPALDGAVLVLDADHNSRRTTLLMQEQLSRAGCPVLGVLLNRAHKLGRSTNILG